MSSVQDCVKYDRKMLHISNSVILYKNLKIKIYKIIIFPVVLYGGEAWSLILRKERRLREFENRILRRIFAPKRDTIGEWRKLHNEERHN